MESRHVLRAALALIVMSGGALPARAEERTIQAAAPWEGRVRVYVTGPRQGFLLGSFAGRLAVEKEPSSLDAAQLVCPAAIDLVSLPFKPSRAPGGTTGSVGGRTHRSVAKDL
jgi:hypothetical protein